MRLKPNTLGLLLVAVVFGGGMLVWELTNQRSAQSPQPEASTGTTLFSFSEDDVVQVQVKTPDLQLAFARSKQAFPATWRMTTPEQSPADEAAIAFLLSQMAAAQSQRSLTIESKQLADYGLAKPIATISVKLKNNSSHTLVLGNETYDQSALYAQADPAKSASSTLKLVPITLRDAISKPLADWKRQPSPSPTLAPSSPSVPTPQAPSVPTVPSPEAE